MKRLLMILLALFLVIPINIRAADNTIGALESGYTNIKFDNGYHGYCLDRDLKGAYINDEFISKDTSEAKSNQTQENISQYLKILFTQYFEELFVSDGNGGYEINFDLKDSVVPGVIYHFTEGQYPWGQQATLVNGIKSYTGELIPDYGYSITLDNGDVITFSFMVMVPKNAEQQYFFAYKLNVSKESTHTHNFGSNWLFDEENHWKECECGEKESVNKHEGGEATCITKKKCSICGKEYGTVDLENHTGETEIRNKKPATTEEEGYTGDTHCKDCGTLLIKGEAIEKLHKHDFGSWLTNETQHWKECECGEKESVNKHEGGEATCVTKKKCSICGEEYGTVDLENHTGEIEIRNKKPATTEEEGYTGDTHCKDCGTLLIKGEAIEKLHKHEFDSDWLNDQENHWKECECGEKESVNKHEGGEATCITKKRCSICGKEYGTVNLENHTGETEIRNAKPATTEEEGYTGDTHCKDCGTLLIKGEVIKKLHKHEFDSDWLNDQENHWKECECGEKESVNKHEGGEATCITKKRCSICRKEYGTVDLENHTGETEIRNAKPATTEEEGYTGDTHCKDCGTLLIKGEVISKLHKHEFDSDWLSDEENHWKECECGEIGEVEKHKDKEVIGIDKMKCEICGKEFELIEPEEPSNPDTPVVPDNPEKPEEPKDPEEPVKPEEPSNPDTPAVPDNPEDSEEPKDPEEPVKPEKPSNPDTPVVPDNPENPEEPKDPQEPVKQETPKEPNTPNTGDNSNVLLWLVFMISTAVCCLFAVIKKYKNV